MLKFFCFTCLFIGLFSDSMMSAQTIAEKKAGLESRVPSDLSEELQLQLKQVNEQYIILQDQLHQLYTQAENLYKSHAPDCSYQDLLRQINLVKDQLRRLASDWRTTVSQGKDEGYALWHQPNTTLEQLVIDYGSQDYVYLIPDKIAAIPLSVTSNLPIPRGAWDEMLETILVQNGIGIKQLNPYLRELFFLKEDRSGLELVTNRRQDLQAFPSNARVAFVLTPEPSDVRRVWFFLEKFINPASVTLQMIGRDILIVARVSEVQELLKLYDFASANRGDKDYKTVTLQRVDPEEMAKILSAMFGIFAEEPMIISPTERQGSPGEKRFPPAPPPKNLGPPLRNLGGDDNGLKIIPLPKVAKAVFLVGTRDEIRRAERIIREVEQQIGEARGRVIYSYVAKHSDPEELAEVLSRIYTLLVSNNIVDQGDLPPTEGPPFLPPPPEVIDNPVPVLRRPYDQGFFLDDRFVINRIPPRGVPVVNQGRDNFIVDPKTGGIVMVVEADLLPKVKELIRQIDVPKKMVQIEVLLFEKRLRRETNFGMNVLKLGTIASHTNETSATFNVRNIETPAFHIIDVLPGVFNFLLSRDSHDGYPAFDLAYRFLLAQEDIHINANPSILAVNQTPAIIEIAEEISVSTGIFEVETISGVTLKDAFSRAQYGIKIEIVPTIHLAADNDGDENGFDYVTMVTDITFQTIQPALNSRPDVTTRHILNEVNIPDGETVILGGLRQRRSREASEKLPFLGEIPGIGKFFGLNEMRDETTEMFIFITPKIIYEPLCDLERIRWEEMRRRPGDIPYFLCVLNEAQERESNRLFSATMAVLFGRQPDRCVCPLGEYDGR